MRVVRWLAALALAVAGVSFTAAPATAASGYCTGSGVNVVVDFSGLSGGVNKGCGSGSTATAAFNSAGFSIRYSQTGGMAGFVCTVDNQPANHQCSGANGQGYWALFIADPRGSWTYTSLGADSQPVRAAQTIAFAWQSPSQANGAHRVPATTPAPVYVAPKPTPKPQAKPTMAATPRAVVPTESATATPSATAHAAHKPTTSPSAAPSAAPSKGKAPVETGPQTPLQPAESKSNGLPWWIPAGIGVALVAGAVGTWLRKRSS